MKKKILHKVDFTTNMSLYFQIVNLFSRYHNGKVRFRARLSWYLFCEKTASYSKNFKHDRCE